MRNWWLPILLSGLLVMSAGPVAADVVVVGLWVPTKDKKAELLLILLRGQVSRGSGRIKTITHRKFRDIQLHLRYRNMAEPVFIKEVIRVPRLRQQFQRHLARVKPDDTKGLMEVAAWAIRHGMLPEFYQTVQRVLEQQPDHAVARTIMELKKRLDEPLADYEAEQRQLRKMLGDSMRLMRSRHYIIAYDTSERRAKERLELLERVYETFFMFFALHGRLLQKPSRPLMVALFADYDDYMHYAGSQDESLRQTAGYWSSETNVAVFYAQGTHPEYKKLNELSQRLQHEKEELMRQRRYLGSFVGDFRRLADTIELLRRVAQENEDIETVSHEATHQLAGNSGLMPRHILAPKWAQEGLAAFFESPRDAAWSGVGAVNQLRLDYYRALEDDRQHSNIQFVVTDRIYRYAATHEATLHAYGQAWALTHYLMTNRFDDLNRFYQVLAGLPSDMVLSDQVLERCFKQVFGEELESLERQWRRHMRGLRTDLDRLRKAYGVLE